MIIRSEVDIDLGTIIKAMIVNFSDPQFGKNDCDHVCWPLIKQLKVAIDNAIKLER